MCCNETSVTINRTVVNRTADDPEGFCMTVTTTYSGQDECGLRPPIVVVDTTDVYDTGGPQIVNFTNRTVVCEIPPNDTLTWVDDCDGTGTTDVIAETLVEGDCSLRQSGGVCVIRRDYAPVTDSCGHTINPSIFITIELKCRKSFRASPVPPCVEICFAADCVVNLTWSEREATNFSCQEGPPPPAQSCAESCCNVTLEFEEVRVNRTMADPPGLCYTLQRTLTAADVCFSLPVSETRVLQAWDDSPPQFVGLDPVITVNCTLPPLEPAVAGDNCTSVALTFSDELVAVLGAAQVFQRTYTATDDCGLVTNATQSITVDFSNC